MGHNENLGSTFFFALADPFPQVLRSLSVGYLARARAKLDAALAAAGEHQPDWRFGWVHPGYGSAPGFDPALEGTPLTHVGWISRDAYDAPGSAGDQRYERLGRGLLVGAPALRWGATSSRAYWSDAAPDDPAGDVHALMTFAVDEPTDWNFDALTVACPDPSEPLRVAARAVRDNDISAFRAAIDAAAAVYSPAGLLLARAGLAHAWSARALGAY